MPGHLRVAVSNVALNPFLGTSSSKIGRNPAVRITLGLTSIITKSMLAEEASAVGASGSGAGIKAMSLGAFHDMALSGEGDRFELTVLDVDGCVVSQSNKG